jgi:hypothetical protein
MTEPPAQHPFLLRLAIRLLAKAERSSASGPVRLKLDAREAPELHAQVDAEEVQRHLLLLEHLCSTGCTVLRLAPRREFDAVMDRNPQLELLDAQALAQWAGYTPKAQRWQSQWLQHVQRRWSGRGDASALLEYLARNPLLALQDLPLEEAARSLDALQELCAAERELPLREASARAFQGRSKILDNRDELLRLLGARPGQFPEAPIQLLVDLPEVVADVVFVENLVTFERMADERRPRWEQSALVYAAGFRGSARRLRTRSGSRLYLRAPALRSAELRTLEQWLFGSLDLPVFFFGDLDYAGLQILGSLRAVFPAASAWSPGYEHLAALLEAGGGHSPELAEKSLQADPGSTGCPFSDECLLPLLRRTGRFVDQEAFSP